MNKWVYEPRAYWEERGKQYIKKAPLVEYEYFQSVVEETNPCNILEVGSGSGQIYDTLAQIGYANRFTGCDFVDSMLESHFENTGIMPDKWNGTCLPYADNSFGMVVSFYVMLHVQEKNIRSVFGEHIRVAKTSLYIVTYMPKKEKPLAPHCFSHNYLQLIEMNCGIIVSEMRFDDRVHLLVQKGKNRE